MLVCVLLNLFKFAPHVAFRSNWIFVLFSWTNLYFLSCENKFKVRIFIILVYLLPFVRYIHILTKWSQLMNIYLLIYFSSSSVTKLLTLFTMLYSLLYICLQSVNGFFYRRFFKFVEFWFSSSYLSNINSLKREA